MENLSYQEADKLRDEIVAGLPRRVRRLTATALTRVNLDDSKSSWKVVVLLENEDDEAKVAAHIPKDDRDNVTFKAIGTAEKI